MNCEGIQKWSSWLKKGKLISSILAELQKNKLFSRWKIGDFKHTYDDRIWSYVIIWNNASKIERYRDVSD